MSQKSIEAMQNYLDILIKEENIHRQKMKELKPDSEEYNQHRRLYLMRKRERQRIILESLEKSLEQLSVKNKCGKNGAPILGLEQLA